jgi:hypothetical protein
MPLTCRHAPHLHCGQRLHDRRDIRVRRTGKIRTADCPGRRFTFTEEKRFCRFDRDQCPYALHRIHIGQPWFFLHVCRPRPVEQLSYRLTVVRRIEAMRKSGDCFIFSDDMRFPFREHPPRTAHAATVQMCMCRDRCANECRRCRVLALPRRCLRRVHTGQHAIPTCRTACLQQVTLSWAISHCRASGVPGQATTRLSGSSGTYGPAPNSHPTPPAPRRPR